MNTSAVSGDTDRSSGEGLAGAAVVSMTPVVDVSDGACNCWTDTTRADGPRSSDSDASAADVVLSTTTATSPSGSRSAYSETPVGRGSAAPTVVFSRVPPSSPLTSCRPEKMGPACIVPGWAGSGTHSGV